MFHKATDVYFKDGTVLEVKFQSGEVKQYDMSLLYAKYPQLKALNERSLFITGRLLGSSGIIWNDELDIETETIYEEGETVRVEDVPLTMQVGAAVAEARARAGISQKELAAITGIDQSDISKIERGAANPSISTLNRIASALGAKLAILIA